MNVITTNRYPHNAELFPDRSCTGGEPSRLAPRKSPVLSRNELRRAVIEILG